MILTAARQWPSIGNSHVSGHMEGRTHWIITTENNFSVFMDLGLVTTQTQKE